MAEKNSGKHQVSVLLVDDHPIVRSGLAQLFHLEPGLEVVAEAADAHQAVAFVKSHQPQLIVTDLTLNGIGGLELIKHIHAMAPDLLILVFSMHDEVIYAERTLRAGAKGYVMKQAGPDVLRAAVRLVLHGQVYLSEAMTARMVGKMAGNGNHSPEYRSGFTLLSDRELEVYELIGRGLTTRMMAARLCVSVKTIEAHREHIKRKLSIQHSAELTTHAAQWVLQGSQPKTLAASA